MSINILNIWKCSKHSQLSIRNYTECGKLMKELVVGFVAVHFRASKFPGAVVSCMILLKARITGFVRFSKGSSLLHWKGLEESALPYGMLLLIVQPTAVPFVILLCAICAVAVAVGIATVGITAMEIATVIAVVAAQVLDPLLPFIKEGQQLAEFALRRVKRGCNDCPFAAHLVGHHFFHHTQNG